MRLLINNHKCHVLAHILYLTFMSLDMNEPKLLIVSNSALTSKNKKDTSEPKLRVVPR